VNQATSSIVSTSIATIINATKAIAMIANLTIIIKTIDAMIVVVTKIRTLRAGSPTKRRMIARVIASRKRATIPCTMTSPLHQAWATQPEKGVSLAQDLFCALVLGLPVETLADPYKGRIPLPSVPNYQEQDLSCHLIRTGTNTTPDGQESFLNGKRMKLSFPTIVTE
jgi:hypothetical protein